MTRINPAATAATVIAQYDRPVTTTVTTPGWLWGTNTETHTTPADGILTPSEARLFRAEANPNHPFVLAISELPDAEFAKVRMTPDLVQNYLYNKYAALFVRWDAGGGGDNFNGKVSGAELQARGGIDAFLADCRQTMEPRDMALMSRIADWSGILGDGFSQVDAAKLRLAANTVNTPQGTPVDGAFRKP